MRTLCLMILCVLTSCVMKEKGIQPGEHCPGTLTEACFATDVAGDRDGRLKSIFPDGIEGVISDITLASYGTDGSLADVRYYQSDFSSMLLSVDGKSDVYALVNMGDMSSAFPASADMIGSLEYEIDSYPEMEFRGFPMSGTLKGYSAEQGPGTIVVERLLAKVRVRITHNGLSGYSESAEYAYNMCNNSLYIRQANKRLRPFSPEGSRAEDLSDILGVSDYNPDLNDRTAYEGSLSQAELGPGPGYQQDTTIVFYVPENIQGKLLPDNADPFGKVYDKIDCLGGVSYSDICTYLEFNARRENTLGYSGGVTYRYYLGADNTSDFSLIRNECYDITLDFTEEGFFADNWKVVRGEDWNDGRVLEFVDGPYQVSRGGTSRILVYYSRDGRISQDSQHYPEDWEFVVDESALVEAGLSYSYDPDVLVEDDDGYEKFCIIITASADADLETEIPVRVVSADGALYDESTISVVEREDFAVSWTLRPEYVSQVGTMTIEGVADSDLPLEISFSDESVLECTRTDDDSFRIAAVRPGYVEVTITDRSGVRSATVPMLVKPPTLLMDDTRIALNPDGEDGIIGYSYVDDMGRPLTGVDADVFYEYLLPSVRAGSYFTSVSTLSYIRVNISSVYDSVGEMICPGYDYEAEVSAADCPGVNAVRIMLNVSDPFDGVSVRDYGIVDDYTLFSMDAADDVLRTMFQNKISANAVYEYQACVPDAGNEYVSAALEPVWTDGFSAANGVFKAELDTSDGTIRLLQANVTSSTSHSAGRHNMMLYVTNRHSLEKLGCICGVLDVYVHTAIGAKAVFGSQLCRYNPYGNETFASVYNYIAGTSVYPYPSSSSLIHYMDVFLDWMTPVSGVYVFDSMDKAVVSGVNVLDALDVVRPSVADGQLDANTRMLYSVMSSRDSRISVCGESYGPHKGIGGVLYRALLQATSASPLAEKDLMQRFFGYQMATGAGSAAYAPCFTVHDKNKGNDMTTNIVNSRKPYYFSPQSCNEYVDGEGRGYHVIHFLEEILPATCGWVNLM